MTRTGPLLLALAAMLQTACSDSPQEPAVPAPVDDSMLGIMFGSAAAVPAGGTGTHPCPAGGSTTRDFEIEQSADGDIITVEYWIRFEHDQCAIELPNFTLIMDGTLLVEGLERRRVTDKSTEILEGRSRQTGTMRWRHDGYDRTCDIDVTLTLIPATGERRLEGTMCGDPVSIVIPRFQR